MKSVTVFIACILFAFSQAIIQNWLPKTRSTLLKIKKSIHSKAYTECRIPSKLLNLNTEIQSCFKKQTKKLLVIVFPANIIVSVGAQISNHSNFAILFEGKVTYEAYEGGQPNFLTVENSQNFLITSSPGKVGGVIGKGYMSTGGNRRRAPCLVRLHSCDTFAITNIAIIDSPKFHLVLGSVSNAEISGLLIQGQEVGATDGIDVSGENVYIHDLEVSNRDECVTIKNPSNNIYVKNILCNVSGGSAMGSLGFDTAISNIVYENIYNYHTNHGYMIKSYYGSGLVTNLTLNNFILDSTAYGFQLITNWKYPGKVNQVRHENIYIYNWNGSIYNDPRQHRPSFQATCRPTAPCKNINVCQFNVKQSKFAMDVTNAKLNPSKCVKISDVKFSEHEIQSSKYIRGVGPKLFPTKIRTTFFPNQMYENMFNL